MNELICALANDGNASMPFKLATKFVSLQTLDALVDIEVIEIVRVDGQSMVQLTDAYMAER